MNLNHIQHKDWRLLDSSAFPLVGEALLPFAVDELECRLIGKGAQPLLHIWRHKRAFILGLRDRKLERAHLAMEALGKRGYAVAVRNSGGAAVPLDDGVLNISLILPNPSGITKLHDDFAILAGLIQETTYRLAGNVEGLATNVAVDVGEIAGAYCPGAFDLAIEGRKFCGIAQRRQTGAYIVQAFIVIEGVGAERARLVADYYRDAAGANESGYPIVNEQTTASLQELIENASVEHFVREFKKNLLGDKELSREFNSYDGYNEFELSQLIKQMVNRYDTN